MKEHINYWDKFPKTDEKYTKGANVDGNNLTSIDGVYMVKLATEVLGPIGIGWGYKILSERMDNGKPIILFEGDKVNGISPIYMLDGGTIVYEKTHTLLLEMWVAEKENTFSQYGHTKFTYMTKKGGYYVDHEYAKKSVTDAMKKCLSLVGVCSDVFMGEFDDTGYKAQAKLETELSKATKGDQAYMQKVTELRTYLKTQAMNITLCPTMDAVTKVYTIANGRVAREAEFIGLNIEEEREVIDEAYRQTEQKLKNERTA